MNKKIFLTCLAAGILVFLLPAREVKADVYKRQVHGFDVCGLFPDGGKAGSSHLFPSGHDNE